MNKRNLWFRFLTWIYAMAMITPAMFLMLFAWRYLHQASFEAWWVPWALALPTTLLHGVVLRWLRKGIGMD